MTTAEEKIHWDNLKKLADQGNVPEFYAKYAQYLEAAGIYSESRKALHKMAKLASDTLSPLK